LFHFGSNKTLGYGYFVAFKQATVNKYVTGSQDK